MSFPAFLLWLLRRWYFWTFVVLAVLVVSAVSWYYSDADLKAVDERAKALGVPLEWKDFPVKPISPEKQTQLQRIFDLQKELGCYSETDEAPNAPIRSFEPLPQKMLELHEKMDQKKIQRLYQEIDTLTPAIFHTKEDASSKPIMQTIGGFRSLTRFFEERIRLAPSKEVAPTYRRMLAVLQNRNTGSCLDLLVSVSLAAIANNAICQRLPDLVLHDPNIADELIRLAEQLEQELPQVMVGEFISGWKYIHLIKNGQYKPSVFSFLEDETLPTWVMPLVFRCGRKQVLSDNLDLITIYRNAQSLKELFAKIRHLEADWIRGEEQRKTHNKYLRFLLFPNRTLQDFVFGRASEKIIPTQVFKTALHLRLVAAEIRKTPWPTDVFSPNDASLHRVERDGKLVGVYSVGMNGVDDGGLRDSASGKDDIYLPLYGPQFPPKSATRAECNSAIPEGSAPTSGTSNRISRAP